MGLLTTCFRCACSSFFSKELTTPFILSIILEPLEPLLGLNNVGEWYELLGLVELVFTLGREGDAVFIIIEVKGATGVIEPTWYLEEEADWDDGPFNVEFDPSTLDDVGFWVIDVFCFGLLVGVVASWGVFVTVVVGDVDLIDVSAFSWSCSPDFTVFRTRFSEITGFALGCCLAFSLYSSGASSDS